MGYLGYGLFQEIAFTIYDSLVTIHLRPSLPLHGLTYHTDEVVLFRECAHYYCLALVIARRTNGLSRLASAICLSIQRFHQGNYNRKTEYSIPGLLVCSINLIHFLYVTHLLTRACAAGRARNDYVNTERRSKRAKNIKYALGSPVSTTRCSAGE